MSLPPVLHYILEDRNAAQKQKKEEYPGGYPEVSSIDIQRGQYNIEDPDLPIGSEEIPQTQQIIPVWPARVSRPLYTYPSFPPSSEPPPPPAQPELPPQEPRGPRQPFRRSIVGGEEKPITLRPGEERYIRRSPREKIPQNELETIRGMGERRTLRLTPDGKIYDEVHSFSPDYPDSYKFNPFLGPVYDYELVPEVGLDGKVARYVSNVEPKSRIVRPLVDLLKNAPGAIIGGEVGEEAGKYLPRLPGEYDPVADTFYYSAGSDVGFSTSAGAMEAARLYGSGARLGPALAAGAAEGLATFTNPYGIALTLTPPVAHAIAVWHNKSKRDEMWDKYGWEGVKAWDKAMASFDKEKEKEEKQKAVEALLLDKKRLDDALKNITSPEEKQRLRDNWSNMTSYEKGLRAGEKESIPSQIQRGVVDAYNALESLPGDVERSLQKRSGITRPIF